MYIFRFNIFKSENVHRSLFPLDASDSDIDYKNYIDLNTESDFSFSRFCDLSPQEIEDVHLTGTFCTFLRQNLRNKFLRQLQHSMTWGTPIPLNRLFFEASHSLSIFSLMESHSDLLFTRWVRNS